MWYPRGKSELLLVPQPPGDVEMRRRSRRSCSAACPRVRARRRRAVADGIHQIAPDLAGRVRQALRMAGRLRVEQQPCRLARARGEHDGAAADLRLAACRLVDVRHGGDLARVVGDRARAPSRWRAPDAARLHGRKDLHVARGVVRRRLAAAAALPAVVARAAAVARNGRDGLAAGTARMPSLAHDALHEHVVRAQRGRRIEDAVGRAADPFLRAGDADERLGLVVVRREILVADRPVDTRVRHVSSAGSRNQRTAASRGRSDSCGRRGRAIGTRRNRCQARRCTARPRAARRRNVALYVNGERPKYPSAFGPTPRCGTSYGHMCSLKSPGFSIGPASSSRTDMPRSARTLVTVPPPAPDPITTTSCVVVLAVTCDHAGRPPV